MTSVAEACHQRKSDIASGLHREGKRGDLERLFLRSDGAKSTQRGASNLRPAIDRETREGINRSIPKSPRERMHRTNREAFLHPFPVEERDELIERLVLDRIDRIRRVVDDAHWF